MKTYTWSLEPGHFFGMTEAQTVDQFNMCFSELTSFCRDLRFDRRDRGGNLRFSILPRNQNQGNALGYHHGGGRITLGGTDDPSSDIGWPEANFHTYVVTIQHEIGHYWGWKHKTTDSDCAMNPWLPQDRDMCAGEVLWMQDKWGIPEKKFYPYSYASRGKKIRDLQALRKELVKKRDGSIVKSFRQGVQAEIVEAVRLETKLAIEWHQHRKSWLKVPMAG